MKTFGSWQQDVSWNLQLLYGYSLPVFIFKFGYDLFSPMRVASQERRARECGDALRKVTEDLRRYGRVGSCDIIAHSFGTLIVSRVISTASYDDVPVGRLILTGSIVEQGFDWQRLLDSRRVEAVLNHRAGRDKVVPVARWIFPRTGPSGVRGFVGSPAVVEVLSPALAHSDYFRREEFDRTVRRIWARFFESKPLDARDLAPNAPTGSPTSPRYWVGRIALGIALILLGAVAYAVL